MWILFPRAPVPDAAYWPGRRLLAALDALLWPGVWLVVIFCGPFETGIVGTVAAFCLLVAACARLQRALVRNERYRFTAWRWGPWVAIALGIGVFTKLMSS